MSSNEASSSTPVFGGVEFNRILEQIPPASPRSEQDYNSSGNSIEFQYGAVVSL